MVDKMIGRLVPVVLLTVLCQASLAATFDTIEATKRRGVSMDEVAPPYRGSGDDDMSRQQPTHAPSWGGDYPIAIPTFEKPSHNSRDVDTRPPFATALPDSGDVERVVENRQLLRADNEPPAQPFTSLDLAISRRPMTRVTPLYTYYDDTDDNVRAESGVLIRHPVGKFGVGLHLRQIQAEDPLRDNDATLTIGEIDVPVSAAAAVVAGLGTVRLERTFTVGFVETRARKGSWRINARLGRDVLVDTAEIIESNVAIDEVELRTHFQANDRLAVALTSAFRDYSDDNRSSDIEFALPYTLRTSRPRLDLGYRRREVRFDRQTGSGYFDPDELTSDQLVLTWTHNSRRFNGNLEFFAGRQSSRRFGNKNDDDVVGFYASLRHDVTRRFSLELEAEGGDFALQNPTGFEYFMITFRLAAFF